MRLNPFTLAFFLSLLSFWACKDPQAETQPPQRPNILLAISDDQSFPHTSAYGTTWIQTPAFDWVANEGVLFMNGYAGSPGCSPSRASLLTGRNCWQIGAAGTHASHFSTDYVTYPELLKEAGYHVGHTGKGWGPGNFEISGRTVNPAGAVIQEHQMEAPEGISDKDYASNFQSFLANKSEDQPFCFWFGAHEPHRKFKKGIGLEMGKDPASVKVPDFLPDDPEIRSDLLDYAVEIEWFDQHLGKILEILEEAGELENTLIIVTSDNGMAFPRAKANTYEYGVHVPLAVYWGGNIKGGRTVEDLVGFTDLAPTILEAAGVTHPGGGFPMTGTSILSLLQSDQEGLVEESREVVFSSRERHSSSRYHSLSYPQRCLRNGDYLYIRNFTPERWPSGAPQKYGLGNYPTVEEVEQKVLGPMHGAYPDIDDCPTKTFLIEHRDDPAVAPYFHWAMDKRPGEELYNVKEDPSCLNNLVENADHQSIKQGLQARMEQYLTETQDPRILGNGDVWETYPRYSRLRAYPTPDWAVEKPEKVPQMEWWEQRWEEGKP